MQVEEVLALQPTPGTVTRHMWVLSHGMPPEVHCWPKLQDVLAAEYIAKITNASGHVHVVLSSQWHQRIRLQQNMTLS